MAIPMLSTQEVASIINVTETTIKRWSDSGNLSCIKTLGGHRKYRMADVVAFAEEHGFPLSDAKPPRMKNEQIEQLQIGVVTRSYTKVADIFLQEALQGNRNGLHQLLLYLYKHHISLSSIADEVIRPALVRIGELWKHGRLEINQEHRASNAIIEAFVRFAPDLHHKPTNGLTAVLACPEDEYHEIGLRCLSHVLENEGWNAQYIGANTPSDTLQSYIKTLKPDVVCISFTLITKKEKFLKQMKSLGRLIHSYNGKFLVGGFYSSMYDENDFGCNAIVGSATEAVVYLKNVFRLKPGPKKNLNAERPVVGQISNPLK